MPTHSNTHTHAHTHVYTYEHAFEFQRHDFFPIAFKTLFILLLKSVLFNATDTHFKRNVYNAISKPEMNIVYLLCLKFNVLVQLQCKQCNIVTRRRVHQLYNIIIFRDFNRIYFSTTIHTFH